MTELAGVTAPHELLHWPPTPWPAAPRPAPAPHARRGATHRDAAFSAAVLTGVLAGIYAISAVTVPQDAALLAAIAAGQALIALATIRGRGRRTLIAGCAIQVLLAFTWLASRTVGLPLSDGPHSVGLLDALIAADELLIAIVLLKLATRRKVGLLIAESALVLAAVTLTAMTSGHTQPVPAAGQASPAPTGEQQQPYCKLI